MSVHARTIANLHAAIERIGSQSVLAGTGDMGTTGVETMRLGVRTVATDGLPPIGAGTLNEIFVANTRDAGAGFGFALMQAQKLVSRNRPVVLWLQLRAEAEETGLPYGPGLSGFGFDPRALVLVRTKTVSELLWAMEEAAGCGTVAAAISDVAHAHKALDFTASRRLSLRAARFGTALVFLRSGAEREASAAALRWHVMPIPSAEAAFDVRAPGVARYRVTLEKGARRLGLRARRRDAFGRDFWDLQWSEHGLVADLPERRDTTGTRGRTALSGAFAAGLGDRLSQTA